MSLFLVNEFFNYAEFNDQNKRYANFFFQFLKEEIGIVNTNDFKNLGIDTILNSLFAYMHESNSISKRSASQYIGCLGKVFDCLFKYYNIENNIYVNGSFVPEFENRYREALSQYTDIQEVTTASDDDLKALQFRIAELEKDYSFEDAVEGLKRFFTTNYTRSLAPFVSIRSICATLFVLEFGLKNEEISTIKIDDINLLDSSIKRGRYTLKISNEFKQHLYEYFRIREYILSKNSETTSFLFINHVGKPISNGQEGCKLFDKTISKVISGKSGTTLFAKRFIRKMIIAGINIATIEELTGHGYKTCKDVCDFVNTHYFQRNQNNLTYFMDSKRNTIICPDCEERVEATSKNLVLIKKPGNDTLLLRCRKCGEKEKEKARRNFDE